MKQKKEPKLWVTVLLLVMGALAIIGLVGFALWYAGQSETDTPAAGSGSSWGIFSDSPIRSKR